MKYLNLFNEAKIQLMEFEDNLRLENRELFTTSDYNRIKTCVTSCKTFSDKYNFIFDHSVYKTMILITNITDSGFIKVYKCKDEWYYINNSNKTYYKCDQLNDLLSTLKRINYQFNMYKNYIPGKYI